MIHEDNIMNLIARIVKGNEVIKVHNYQQPMLKEFRNQIQGQMELDMRRAKYNGIFSGVTDCYQKKYHLLVMDITHNMNEMERFDRVIIADDGKACFIN